MKLEEIKKLIKLVEKSRISKLEIEENDRKISITKSEGGAVFSAPAFPAPPAAPPAPPAPVAEEAKPAKPPKEEEAKQYHEIKSPMVGTFYQAPAEDAEPFVKVGDNVEKGQTLCIIEAMKLMNEIESDIRGKVIEILPENGAPIEYGEVLLKLDPA
jgi:acetyl-CoA carboxylase biotin carboxyl carrier protein